MAGWSRLGPEGGLRLGAAGEEWLCTPRKGTARRGESRQARHVAMCWTGLGMAASAGCGRRGRVSSGLAWRGRSWLGRCGVSRSVRSGGAGWLKARQFRHGQQRRCMARRVAEWQAASGKLRQGMVANGPVRRGRRGPASFVEDGSGWYGRRGLFGPGFCGLARRCIAGQAGSVQLRRPLARSGR